jgi:hypothetical protein
LCNEPRHGIDAAARRHRHNDADGALGIIFRCILLRDGGLKARREASRRERHESAELCISGSVAKHLPSIG